MMIVRLPGHPLVQDSLKQCITLYPLTARYSIGPLRESWIRGCPDGRTKTFGRTPGLGRYKIEDSVPYPDGTFLGVEGKLGDTI